MLVAATNARSVCHSGARWGRPPSKTRTIIANAAAFVPTDMKAVTGRGANCTTSDAHMRHGAADTLKAKPTPINTIPSRINGLLEADELSRLAISGITVVPAPP